MKEHTVSTPNKIVIREMMIISVILTANLWFDSHLD